LKERASGKVLVALTPNPSPAVRERGELVGGIGIVERRRLRIVPALLISPFLSRSVREEGGAGGRCGPPGVLRNTSSATVASPRC